MNLDHIRSKLPHYCFIPLRPEEEERDEVLGLKKKGILVDVSESKLDYPGLMPTGALVQYGHLLSPYEKKEILGYHRVYCFPKNNSKLSQIDFERFYNKLTPGDHIQYRYQVEEMIGFGSISKVVKAQDFHLRRDVAIKVSLKLSIYHDMNTLLKLKLWDPKNSQNFVRIMDYGIFRGTGYLVMDRYDTDLKNYMDTYYSKGIPLKKIGRMARSILHAMVFLKNNNLIHGDIQPNNILLNLSNPNALKLADFELAFLIGTARKTNEQSQEYRAPETLCAGKRSCAEDMWSFGCLIGEMYKNEKFLHGENDRDQIFFIMQILDLPPLQFYAEHQMCQYCFPSLDGRRDRILDPRHVLPMNGRVVVETEYSGASKHRLLPGATRLRTFFEKPEEKDLCNFMTRTLKWLPGQRLTPEHVLNLPFFNVMPDTSSSSDDEPMDTAETPESITPAVSTSTYGSRDKSP